MQQHPRGRCGGPGFFAAVHRPLCAPAAAAAPLTERGPPFTDLVVIPELSGATLSV